ncbi:MAG: hypothetical protein O0X49_00350 [Methanocorpusculum sp.]|nr:hypothetical protein [Methanocorpusculum sp.]
MKRDIYYRVDRRVQNGVVKYYLMREVNSDSHKFRASKLIKAGTPPTDPEITRAILLYGFDLEMKCCEKVVSYRVKNFKYEHEENEKIYYHLEKYRYLDLRYHDYLTEEEYTRHVNEREYHYIHESAKTVGCTFTFPEVVQMIETGKIPNGKYLRDVNEIQNLYRCVVLRNKNPRKVTLALVLQIRRIILQNLEEPETISREKEIAIQKLLNTYYQKIGDGYHPVEQIISLHKNFRKLKPFKIGSKRTIREVVQYLVMPLGYPLSSQSSQQIVHTSEILAEQQTKNSIPQVIEQYTGCKISNLEDQLRKKIAEHWDIQKNKSQKQLSLYLRPSR